MNFSEKRIYLEEKSPTNTFLSYTNNYILKNGRRVDKRCRYIRHKYNLYNHVQLKKGRYSFGEIVGFNQNSNTYMIKLTKTRRGVDFPNKKKFIIYAFEHEIKLV
jgi:hypothetical protein